MDNLSILRGGVVVHSFDINKGIFKNTPIKNCNVIGQERKIFCQLSKIIHCENIQKKNLVLFQISIHLFN